MEPVKAFWIEPVPNLFNFYLRRYSGGEAACPGPFTTWHNARAALGTAGAEFAPEIRNGRPVSGDMWAHGDPRWPVKCDHCDYTFKLEDGWQFDHEAVYTRPDTGERFELRAAPIGAIWESAWLREYPQYCGPDGRALHARVPGGCDWGIDSRASNCGSPCAHCGVAYRDHAASGPGGHNYQDARPEHRCWIRHGVPPELTVDKNGNTCDAGAGSIQTSNWHGFLQGGYFRA